MKVRQLTLEQKNTLTDKVWGYEGQAYQITLRRQV